MIAICSYLSQKCCICAIHVLYGDYGWGQGYDKGRARARLRTRTRAGFKVKVGARVRVRVRVRINFFHPQDDMLLQLCCWFFLW
jgi:hypothetical protein